MNPILSRLCLLLPALLWSTSPGAAEHALQRQANAALALMTFTVTPDITASNLNIQDQSAGTSSLLMTQLGGGATWSADLPLYLEGNLGFSRYDPRFLLEDGDESITIPARWNTLSATGGIGWDFPLQPELVLRPIANLTLGTMASDLRVADWLWEREQESETSFLDSGRLNAIGYGASLMLDYEHFSPAQDLDAELRFSYIHLQSLGGTDNPISGQANAENLSLYLRRRAPTGLLLFERPLRYVLEGAHTQYLGSQRGLLGFDALTSLGAGVELDLSRFDLLVSRVRLVGRYMFGRNTDGYSIGLAASF
ncbi:autotransporter domain-containing protein [Pseudaeromonas sp. ZJS20]|uniref:autotransporter domain-containing protein n=1 Tax=Pseudaeromonas aegiceratis TaxID=3153928 RepID=UPI00390CA471